MATKTKRWILRLWVFLCLVAVVVLLLPKKRADVPTQELTPAQYSLSAIGKALDVSSFVSADMLEGHLPPFTSFSFLFYDVYSNPHIVRYADAYVYRYTNASYIVTAENYANLYIQNIPRDENASRRFPDIPDHGTVFADVTDPNDLRRAESTGIYRLGELTYYYTDFYLTESSLQYIRWQTDAFCFTLELNGFALDSFAPEDDSFLAGLLCSQTAEAVVEDLNADIGRTLAWRRFTMHWLPRLLAVVISASAVIALILLHKMRVLARAFEDLTSCENSTPGFPEPKAKDPGQLEFLDAFDTLCTKK